MLIIQVNNRKEHGATAREAFSLPTCCYHGLPDSGLMEITQIIIVGGPLFTDLVRIPMEPTVLTRKQGAHSFTPVKRAALPGLRTILENLKALLDMEEAQAAVAVPEDLGSRAGY